VTAPYNHCSGFRIQTCSFYNEYFDYQSIPYWRSVGSKADILRNVDKYFVPLPSSIDPSIFQSLDVVFDYLERSCKLTEKSLKPLSVRDAIKLLPNDTSPGLPYTLQGFTTKGEVKDRLLRDYNIIKKIPNGGTFDLPCSAGVRLALVEKPANKPRLVWVYPASMITAEARFYGPLMSRLFSCLLFSWDFSFLRGGVNSLKQFCHGLTTFGTDVSAFDSTVHPQVIDYVFDWIGSRFVFNDKTLHDFNVMRKYFIHTPLWFKNKVYLKHQGVPSGSFFTQTIDSIVNVAYQLELVKNFTYNSICYRLEDEFRFLRVLGDDSLVSLSYEVTEDEFAYSIEKLNTSYGVVINANKGFFRSTGSVWRYTNFLGFDLSLATPPYLRKSALLIMAQCLFPEVAEKDVSVSMARLIGIKWSSGDDPKSLSVVNYFWDLLQERYPNISPGELPKEYQLMFRYVFGRFVPDISQYPSDELVILRYRGLRDCAVQESYQYGDYWDYVARRHSIVDYLISKLGK